MALLAAVVGFATAGGHRGEPDDADRARAAATRFLDRYVDPDGRVVRRDQGGDTVSEGQAYALLLTAAIGDRVRFERVWRWTRAQLQRDDGLLAWHWSGGQVVDREAAADADLDTARALLVAARRFDTPRYRREAVRVGRAVLRLESVERGRRRILAAAPWAREGTIVNPSYSSPHTYAALVRATGDRRWRELAAGDLHVISALTRSGKLVPDWAQVAPTAIFPVPVPGTSDPARHGFDAVRTPIRLAEACGASARSAHRLAAGAWPRLESGAAIRMLDGAPAADFTHPSALAGAAGAAHAAGDTGARDRLLAAADRTERERSTYYGAAWAALARVMLTTDWLRAC